MGLLLLQFVFSIAFGQTKYDPQALYDPPGGLFDLDSIRTIHLNFYNSNYNSILVQGWQQKSGIRLPATLTMNGQVLDSVAVRYKGNSTFYFANQFNNPKKPYNIDMNQIIGGQKLMGYKKMKLANALFDPSFVKEMIGYQIYRNYMPSPQANHVKLNVQGNYIGCYVNTEPVDAEFLKRHFGEKDGVFIKCDPDAQYGSGDPWFNPDLNWYGPDSTQYYKRYDMKSDAGWDELLHLIDTLNSHTQHIDSILNVDRVLWYFALNQVVPNTDTYNSLVIHNYYLYRTQDGLFQIIPWDLSECFIGAMLSFKSDKDSIYEMSPFEGYDPHNNDMPLVHKLLSDTLNHKIYTEHMRTIRDEFYPSSSVVENMGLAMQSNAYSAVQADQNKWFSMNAYSSNLYNEYTWFGNTYAGVVSTVNKRLPYLNAHPEFVKAAPDIASVTQSVASPDVGDPVYITADVSGAGTVELMVTKSSYRSKFKSIQMVDDGSGGDLLAGDGIYTAMIPYQMAGDVVSYYIRAQNSEAVKLSPRRAEYEFYTYTIPGGVSRDIKPEETFNVYPNPTSGILFVDLADKIGESVKVIGIDGKVVVQEMLGGKSSIRMDLAGLPAGIYLVNVRTNENEFFKKILVK